MLKADIQRFREIIQPKRKLIVLLHNNPDPDSIGSALGIKYIIKQTTAAKAVIAYGGIIGRAENQEMIRSLKIKLTHTSNIDFKRNRNIIMVDTQPGTGNNTLPEGLLPNIVIDHHPLKRFTKKVGYYDVRTDYGSNSSIIYEYINELGIKIDRRLATALYYGIKTDTDDVARERKKQDNEAMMSLYPLISPALLSRIEHPRIPMDYYIHFSEAIKNACVFKDIIISDLNSKCTPDMIAEMSDFLLRMKNIRWVLCLGVYEGGIYFSIRTTAHSMKAGNIAMRISRGLGTAGGHYKSAGGYVNIFNKSPGQIEENIRIIKSNFLKSVKRDTVKCKKVIAEE